jgi:hypothetical protein
MGRGEVSWLLKHNGSAIKVNQVSFPARISRITDLVQYSPCSYSQEFA